MKRTLYFAVIAASFSMASCQKEILTDNSMEGVSVFSAVIDDAVTRTTINTDGTDETNRGKVSWEVGDEITISDGTKTAVYSITEESAILTDGLASFTYKSGDKPSAGAESYTATYGTAITQAQTYSATAGQLPMEGTSDSEDKTKLNFTVSCGLLKLNLTADSSVANKNISLIEVTGTPTGGTETVYSLSCGTDGVSIESANDFYLALPAGSYTNMAFYNKGGLVCQKSAKTAMSISDNNIKPITLTGLTFAPKEGALSGLFSVSATKQVQFSKGNLYYNGSNGNTWRFETNQYDFRTLNGIINTCNDNNEDYSTPANDWGLLGWPCSDSDFGRKTSVGTPYYSGDFIDWGTNSIENGGNKSNIWRTLTKDEWEYLLTIRTINEHSGNGYTYKNCTAGVEIGGNTYKGLFLFPDGYSGERNNMSSYSDFAAINNAGIVFLPVSGQRNSDVWYATGEGHNSTSSSESTDKAYCIRFWSGSDPTFESAGRVNGNSVRLVTDVK